MNFNKWTPSIGDFISTEDDYTKKHSWMLKKEKIRNYSLLTSIFLITLSVFVLALFITSKI